MFAQHLVSLTLGNTYSKWCVDDANYADYCPSTCNIIYLWYFIHPHVAALDAEFNLN